MGTEFTRRWIDRLAVSAFVTILWLPLLDSWLDLDRSEPLTEKRELAPRPELGLDAGALADFPALFDAYYRDHLGFRDALVRAHQLVMVAGLSVTRLPASDPRAPGSAGEASAQHAQPERVLLGRDGWLFLGESIVANDDGNDPFAKHGGLVYWKSSLEARRDWLARQDIPYLIVIVPDKLSMYPEYLPGHARPASGPSRLDRVLAFLERESQLELLDLRAPLFAAKRGERIYFRTDTHWNELGAYVGYAEIVGRLARWFSGLRAWPRSAFDAQLDESFRGDLASMLGLEHVLGEAAVRLVPRRARSAREVVDGLWAPHGLALDTRARVGGDPDGPRAVLFFDSFGWRLVPLLAEHFERIALYRQRVFHPRIFETERPDVVIEQWVERTFVAFPPRNSPTIEDPTPKVAELQRE